MAWKLANHSHAQSRLTLVLLAVGADLVGFELQEAFNRLLVLGRPFGSGVRGSSRHDVRRNKMLEGGGRGSWCVIFSKDESARLEAGQSDGRQTTSSDLVGLGVKRGKPLFWISTT